MPDLERDQRLLSLVLMSNLVDVTLRDVQGPGQTVPVVAQFPCDVRQPHVRLVDRLGRLRAQARVLLVKRQQFT